MKLHRCCNEKKYIVEAKEAFKKALEYVAKVDMSMNIWKGFLDYNLARAYSANEEQSEAIKYYSSAIKIRKAWTKISTYNITIKNALSSEYFIAKIDYLDMRKKNNLYPSDHIANEYLRLESELDSVCDVDEKLEQLLFVRKLLHSKRFPDSERSHWQASAGISG
jgi:tetratricopeptide (TPR) repeat protein